MRKPVSRVETKSMSENRLTNRVHPPPSHGDHLLVRHGGRVQRLVRRNTTDHVTLEKTDNLDALYAARGALVKREPTTPNHLLSCERQQPNHNRSTMAERREKRNSGATLPSDFSDRLTN
jgi:hypothetical protein